MLNKVTLIGWLGSDPEIRSTNDGTPVCNLSLATTENWKDQNGVSQKRTDWHRIVLWKRLAEIAGQYLKKGSQIYIEGKIQSREYEDPSTGLKRKAYEIIAHEIKMLDKSQNQSTDSNQKH